MSRRCVICDGLQEHRLEIDGRIRAGNESLAAIARHFSISESSIQRHARNHVLRQSKPATGDLPGQLQNLIGRLEETYASACARGDHKTVLDCLKQISGLTTALVEIGKKESSSFEKMTIPEKLQHIRNDGELFQHWLDFCLAELAAAKRATAEREMILRLREEACRPKSIN